MTRLLQPTDEGIAEAARAIRAGRLVAFPTETVYGLGADALNPMACAAVFAAKGRPAFDPLIVHTADGDGARALWSEVPPEADELMRRFWPGPLTIVLPKRDVVPDIVTSGLASVAVRVPDHQVAQALLRSSGRPIAGPSANRFSHPSPTTAQAVIDELGGNVDLVIDGGPARVGVESTIVGRIDGRWILLRPGGVPREAIADALGVEVPVLTRRDLAAPGQLERHYAPTTPLHLIDAPPPPGLDLGGRRVGLLCLRSPARPHGFAAVEVLSEAGDLTQAASRLFEAVRRLEAAGLECLIAEVVPEHGLGLAIRDRLRRASVGTARAAGGRLELEVRRAGG